MKVIIEDLEKENLTSNNILEEVIFIKRKYCVKKITIV
jgi:hypothetical protein